MDTLKSTQSQDILFKIIKDNADIFVFNQRIIDEKFPDQLKKQKNVSSFLKRIK